MSIKFSEINNDRKFGNGRWWGAMMRLEGNAIGLRELSCLVDFFSLLELFFQNNVGEKRRTSQSQTMINVILIEVNLWCKFRVNGS